MINMFLYYYKNNGKIFKITTEPIPLIDMNYSEMECAYDIELINNINDYRIYNNQLIKYDNSILMNKEKENKELLDIILGNLGTPTQLTSYMYSVFNIEKQIKELETQEQTSLIQNNIEKLIKNKEKLQEIIDISQDIYNHFLNDKLNFDEYVKKNELLKINEDGVLSFKYNADDYLKDIEEN